MSSLASLRSSMRLLISPSSTPSKDWLSPIFSTSPSLSVSKSGWLLYDLSSDDEMWFLLAGNFFAMGSFSCVTSTGLSGGTAVAPEEGNQMTNIGSHNICASSKASQQMRQLTDWCSLKFLFSCQCLFQIPEPLLLAKQSQEVLVCNLRKM